MLSQDWAALIAAMTSGSVEDVHAAGGKHSTGSTLAAPRPHPRWARVNLLRAGSVQAVLTQLQQPREGWPTVPMPEVRFTEICNTPAEHTVLYSLARYLFQAHMCRHLSCLCGRSCSAGCLTVQELAK